MNRTLNGAFLLCSLLASTAMAQAPLWQSDNMPAGATVGSSMASGFDVDGDGIHDVLVGAPLFDGTAGVESGAAIIFSGADGSEIRRWEGEAAEDLFGTSVCLLDVGNDGAIEALVGAPEHDGPAGFRSGKAYLFSTVSGAEIRVWNGEAGGGLGDAFGYAVSAADLTGNGEEEVVISAFRHQGAAGDESGKVYAYSSTTGALVRSWEGQSAFDWFGYALDAGARLDGDAIDDVVICAPFHEGSQGRLSGKAYAYSGATGAEIWTLDGDRELGLFGLSLSIVGEATGDAFDDVAIASPDRDAEGIGLNVGKLFLVNGADGQVVWERTGDAKDIQFGMALSAIGDVNGDFRADILTAAPGKHGPEGWGHGEVYVFLSDGTLWSRHLGEHTRDEFGSSLAPLGDIDLDGFPDFAAGAAGYDGGQGYETGKVYAYTGDGCQILAESFGIGLAGTGGFVPSLTVNGGTCNPQSPFLVLEDGLGGAPTFLWVGISETDQFPFFGGHFYIDLASTWVNLGFSLGGTPGVGGAGTFSAPGIDFHGLEGASFVMQATILDAGAIQGVSLSDAARVTIH